MPKLLDLLAKCGNQPLSEMPFRPKAGINADNAMGARLKLSLKITLQLYAYRRSFFTFSSYNLFPIFREFFFNFIKIYPTSSYHIWVEAAIIKLLKNEQHVKPSPEMRKSNGVEIVVKIEQNPIHKGAKRIWWINTVVGTSLVIVSLREGDCTIRPADIAS